MCVLGKKIIIKMKTTCSIFHVSEALRCTFGITANKYTNQEHSLYLVYMTRVLTALLTIIIQTLTSCIFSCSVRTDNRLTIRYILER